MEDSKTPHFEEIEKKTKSLKTGKWEEYEKFYEFHEMQLYGMNFPKDLGEKLFYKLKYEVFDSSRFFEIQDNQQESRLLLKSKCDIKKEFEVFLVDHCWTFKLRQFNEFCEKYPNIIQRVLQMIKYSNIKKDILTVKTFTEKPKFVDFEDAKKVQKMMDYELLSFTLDENKIFKYKYFDFDNFFIENPVESMYDYFENFYKNNSNDNEIINIGISLENNQIKNLNLLKEFLNKLNSLFENKKFILKALWVESNPFELIDENYPEELLLEFDNIELLNRKLNRNSSLWSFEYLFCTYSLESNLNNRYKNKIDNEIYNQIHGIKRLFMDFSGRDPLAIENSNIIQEFLELKKINFIDISDNYYGTDDEENLINFICLFKDLEILIIDEDTDNIFAQINEEETEDALKIVSRNLNKIQNACPNLKIINNYSLEKLKNLESSEDKLKIYQKENWVKKHMWKIIQTYRLMTSNKYDEDSTWYINDEFGCSINHSDSPNFALFPFLFSPSNTFKDDVITYSILWPIKDIKKNEEVTRDYLHNISESMQRSARLTCWFNTPKQYFMDKFYEKIDKLNIISKEFNQCLSTNQKSINNCIIYFKENLLKKYDMKNLFLIKKEEFDFLISDFNKLYRESFNFKSLINKIEENKRNKVKALQNPENDPAFLANSNIYDEDLEEICKKNIISSLTQIDFDRKIDNIEKYFVNNYLSNEKKKKIKVFSDLPYVRENLKNDAFEIINDLSSADILWLNTDVFKIIETGIFDVENKEESKIYFKNQFPFEGIITMKNHLSNLIQDNFGLNNFLGLTYDMETELADFIGNYFYNRENYLDNTWILKPINMTRSMDMIVTDNLDEIIRSVETGPKICQKYMDRPLLLNKKKFDLRFIIVLKKLIPLEIYIYSKMFWVRSANKDFTMDPRTFTDYETHFTVMNYSSFEKKTIYNYEFVEYLEKNNIKWTDIYEKIKFSVKNLFLMAGKNCPQMSDPYSRAIYGIDIMIDQELNPRILEVNFSPDCTRACKFVPEFFDQIFSTLFLENPQGVEKL